MDKKGVSPLIAAVLLIVFTISIGAIILAWMTNYASTTTEAAGTTSEDLVDCAKSAVSIDAVYATTTGKNITKVDVRNIGFAAINVTTVRVSSGDNSCTLVSSTGTNLAAGEIRSYNNTCAFVNCTTYANTRVATTCGGVSASHTSNSTITSC